MGRVLAGQRSPFRTSPSHAAIHVPATAVDIAGNVFAAARVIQGVQRQGRAPEVWMIPRTSICTLWPGV